MTRIAHLSDMHLDRSRERSERFMRALGQVATSGANYLLLTGDLTAGGDPAEFGELSAALRVWPASAVTIVPGNHDGEPEQWNRMLRGPLERFAATSAPGVVNDLGDVRIVAVNTQLARRAPVFAALGGVSEEQLTQLDRLTREPDPGRALVLAMHHGPQWHLLQGFDGLVNSHTVNDLLQRGPHIAVCCGHDHRVLDLESQVFTAASVADHDDPLRLYDIVQGRLRPIYRSGDPGEYMGGLSRLLMVMAHNRPPNALGGDGVFNSAVRMGSSSTGSVLGDGVIGAVAGYLSAPPGPRKWQYAAGGAVVTGLAGLFGLAGTVGYGLIRRRMAARGR
jgi:predicted phosphodiesterase